VAGSDVPFVTEETVNDILEYQFAGILEDLREQGHAADVYWTFGRVNAFLENKNSAPVILGNNMKKDFYRLNFMHLVDIERLLPYERILLNYLALRKTNRKRKLTDNLLIKILERRGCENIGCSGKKRLYHVFFTRWWRWGPSLFNLYNNRRSYDKMIKGEKNVCFKKVDPQALRYVPPFDIHPIFPGEKSSKGTLDIDSEEDLKKTK
ncbi:MAG: hypothetical protein ABIE94_01275, partial [archaeon]